MQLPTADSASYPRAPQFPHQGAYSKPEASTNMMNLHSLTHYHLTEILLENLVQLKFLALGIRYVVAGSLINKSPVTLVISLLSEVICYVKSIA
jgi:hypothetical protein